MSIYKSSPERTRRILGSGLVTASRRDSSETKEVSADSAITNAFLTSQQEDQLREIMREQATRECPRWTFVELQHIADD